jgi:hypothetical protein
VISSEENSEVLAIFGSKQSARLARTSTGTPGWRGQASAQRACSLLDAVSRIAALRKRKRLNSPSPAANSPPVSITG